MAEKKIVLDKKEKKMMVDEIINFYSEENDEEIGILKGEIFLDFVLAKLAPVFYNRGLKDAEAYISSAVEDIKTLEK